MTRKKNKQSTLTRKLQLQQEATINNKMSKSDDVPMRFEVEEGVDDCRMIKALCTDANGNVCKEQLPIFTKNFPKELLILLLEETLAMSDCFE